jgi:hypothetical protein
MTFKKDFKEADGELRSALRDRRLYRPFYHSSYLPLGEWFLPQLEENYGTAVFDAVWETRGRDYDYNPEANPYIFNPNRSRNSFVKPRSLTWADYDDLRDRLITVKIAEGSTADSVAVVVNWVKEKEG